MSLLTDEQRAALEQALAVVPKSRDGWDTQHDAVQSALVPIVGGSTVLDLARWLLSADTRMAAGVREAYEKGLKDAADLTRQLALVADFSDMKAALKDAADTIAALRQEAASE